MYYLHVTTIANNCQPNRKLLHFTEIRSCSHKKILMILFHRSGIICTVVISQALVIHEITHFPFTDKLHRIKRLSREKVSITIRQPRITFDEHGRAVKIETESLYIRPFELILRKGPGQKGKN
jgi:hypothetical protein